MAQRKIIFKCVIGSNLYGTNRADSDEDYMGVFLPSTEDLLGMQSCPSEWTENQKVTDSVRNGKGDVDCKFYSLQRFFELAASGQPAQREFFYIPDNKVIISTPEWELIKQNSNLFLSSNGLSAFIGFAKAQMDKTALKGENLKKIRNLISLKEYCKKNSMLYKEIGTLLSLPDENKHVHFLFDELKETMNHKEDFHNDQTHELVEVVGRSFNYGIPIKTIFAKLEKIESTYGSRSEDALKNTHDLKNLYHAYRLVSEIQEYLETGNITFPRPDADFLKEIRAGNYNADYRQELADKIKNIKDVVEPKSLLSKTADYSKINKLCQQILKKHINDA
jgi:predicted nucleotidyltransferase